MKTYVVTTRDNGVFEVKAIGFSIIDGALVFEAGGPRADAVDTEAFGPGIWIHVKEIESE